jgi:hypothetical protein
MRLGFLSGRADARFVRTGWPGLHIDDAFTAGTRLHTFSGVVRVEPVFIEVDFRKKRFAGEFNWYDSVEAADFVRNNQHTTEPVCWTQLGYASGYASEFFDMLIVYKEVQCAAEGHAHCRVVGKPADLWGPNDPEVMLFRERIAGPADAAFAEPRRALAARTADTALTELDRIVLEPVRNDLDRFAPMALPLLIEGPPGTGRARAARYLQRASGGSGGEIRQVAGRLAGEEICAEIGRTVRGARRSPTTEILLIDGVEEVPADIQPRLARAIEEGLRVGGPRVLALASLGPADRSARSLLHENLWYALSALTVRMPSLAERASDRLAIAGVLLAALSARMGMPAATLDAAASDLVQRAAWPGNIRQMRSVLAAALAAHRLAGPLTGAELAVQLERMTPLSCRSVQGEEGDRRAWLDRALSAGGFSMAELERELYDAAVARTDGNLSAAARLLGLTRAQLAYRLTAREADA